MAAIPLACAAALATIDLIEESTWKMHCASAHYTMDLLSTTWLNAIPSIGQVRGLGLMIGIEFVKNAETHEPDEACATAWLTWPSNAGCCCSGCGKSVVRISPPLCINFRRDRRRPGDFRGGRPTG